MRLRPIQGDPALAEKKYVYSLDWYDRVTDDQLRPYTDHSEINEHCNADAGWEEHYERIREPAGETDLDVRWWEYRGKKETDRAMPLVVCFYEYYNTTWQRIADREGLVILAFEYHKNQRRPELGIGTLGYGPWDDEIASYHTVIERVIEKYDCDRRRIYMNGLSYGDMTTLIYAKRYGETLAGAAFVNGPSCAFNLRRYMLTQDMPALPSLQIRSDDDITCDGFLPGLTFEQQGNEEWLRNIRSRQVILNRNVWMDANGADRRNPRLRSNGKRMFLIYDQAECEVIFAEFNKKCHIAPIDHAELMWSMLFSRYQRGEDGRIVRTGAPLAADEGAAAFSIGCASAYADNRRVQLSAPCVILEPGDNPPRDSVVYCNTECSYASFYVPVDALESCFGLDYTLTMQECTRSQFFFGRGNDAIELRDAVLRFQYRGACYALYTNTCVVEKDGYILDLERPPLFVNGTLMLPARELAELLGLFCAQRNGAVYICGHPFDMGYTFPRLLREEILPEELRVPSFAVELQPAENGSFTVSAQALADGDSLTVRVSPDAGCRTQCVKVALNGVCVPVYSTGENEYTAFNLMGDVSVSAVFEKM